MDRRNEKTIFVLLEHGFESEKIVEADDLGSMTVRELHEATAGGSVDDYYYGIEDYTSLLAPSLTLDVVRDLYRYFNSGRLKIQVWCFKAPLRVRVRVDGNDNYWHIDPDNDVSDVFQKVVDYHPTLLNGDCKLESNGKRCYLGTKIHELDFVLPNLQLEISNSDYISCSSPTGSPKPDYGFCYESCSSSGSKGTPNNDSGFFCYFSSDYDS